MHVHVHVHVSKLIYYEMKSVHNSEKVKKVLTNELHVDMW